MYILRENARKLPRYIVSFLTEHKQYTRNLQNRRMQNRIEASNNIAATVVRHDRTLAPVPPTFTYSTPISMKKAPPQPSQRKPEYSSAFRI